jgi:hypothetical protein
LTLVATSHPTPLSPAPTPQPPAPRSEPNCQGISCARRQGARRNACARRRRASSPASAPRGTPPPPLPLPLPLPPGPRVGVGVDVAATATRAGGWRVTVGLNRDVNLNSLCVCFFFQILPTLFLCCTCTSPSRPCHAFVASFLPSFLPVSSSFFSVASPFRLSAAGRPAFLLQGNQDYPSDLSRGKTKIPRARSRAIFAEFVGSELVSLLLFLFYLNYSGLLGLFLCYFTSFTGLKLVW